MDDQQIEKDLEYCKDLALAGQYADAIEAAKKLQAAQAENMDVHRLLAYLYVRNGQPLEAAPHYMLLAQFDPSFEYRHCIELVGQYHAVGHTDMAAVLAHAGAVKIASKELYQLAADYYHTIGESQQAKELLEIAAGL